ncbi:MAG: ferredoxin [Candidatus Brocadiaceae bacterium]|nr:ferredoxin [Candidatus Brocadiaceae bacterium]
MKEDDVAVWFEEGCVQCGMCAEEAPGVFDFVAGVGPHVKDDADIEVHIETVKQAAYLCPAQCIKYRLSPGEEQ